MTVDILKEQTAVPVLRVLPLGGLGEIGLNMMVFEYEGKILIVDCGLMFPDMNMIGVEYAVPDISALEGREADIVGLVLTHGHEDHIGAVPLLLERLGNPPVFGLPLTVGLLKCRLEECEMRCKPALHTVDPAERLSLPPFEVEFFRVAHSIVDSVGLALRTPAGLVVHTGDFKLDPSPLDGHRVDEERLAAFGREGTLLLLSDSTNVECDGWTPSEREVGAAFAELFPQCRGWLVMTTFSSNIHRIQQAVDCAVALDRRILITGRSMQLVCRVARELGVLRLPDPMLIGFKELRELPRDKVCVITTGSQGEPQSVLTRIARGEHKQLQLEEGDMVIISSRMIPGNECLINQNINNLYRRGAQVHYQGVSPVHVSGHAGRAELQRVLELVQPRWFIPVHGEYRHLARHAELARQLGVETALAENGQPVTVSWRDLSFGEPVPSGRILVDGLGVDLVGLEQLRERRRLAGHGLVVARLTLDEASGALLEPPEFLVRGFVPEEEEEYYAPAASAVQSLLAEAPEELLADEDSLKDAVRRCLQRHFSRALEKRPLIVPLLIWR